MASRLLTYGGTDKVAWTGGPLFYNQTAMSVMFWFRIADTTGKTGDSFLFDCYSAFNIQARLFISAASGGTGTKGQLSFIWRTPTANTNAVTTTTAWDDGNWHRCLLVRRNSSPFVELYVDGVSQVSTTTNPTTDATASTAQYWGNNGASGTNSFGGDLSRCAFALSVYTTTQADNFLYGGNVAGALSQWLELGDGSPEADLSGNGLSGTVTGTTVDTSPPFRFPLPRLSPLFMSTD